MKALHFTLGWLFFALGFVGAFLPVLPTTPFMLLALWSFSKSSPRFHHWLYTHKIFGGTLQRWESQRVIPLSAKLVSVLFMTCSLIYITCCQNTPFSAIILSVPLILYGYWFILSKPSAVQTKKPSSGL